MELAQWMERRYTASYDYRDGGNAPTLPFTDSPRDGGTVFYELTVGSVTQNTYSLKATATVPQTDDPCGNLTLNQVGTKSDEGGAGVTCW
jgi:type IV pilus assembly protein PilE